MPSVLTNHIHQAVGEDLTPQAAGRTRISTRRADRLREFILGHLPASVDVDVIISPAVDTAAVLPADVDAILSSDATDLERAQAEQLLQGVTADYLVLITGQEADLSRIPLNDQLTADHAHQFGLAFHELLHILKTAIGAIAKLIDAEVDDRYHEQVHDLINIVEDGAIESEAIHGENFSDNAGIRLDLTRRLHSQTPDDVPDGDEIRYSFWDAVTASLYDHAIYPTGITDALRDDADDRLGFLTDDDRDAFDAVYDALCELAEKALAIWSADRSDTTHSHDKTASVRRARLVIDTWNTHIQPVLESESPGQPTEPPVDSENQRTDHQGGEPESGEQSSGGSGGEEAASRPDNGCDDGGGSESPGVPTPAQNDAQGATADAEPGRGSRGDGDPRSALPDQFDPGNVSISREATTDPHQNIFEQPRITADPDPDDTLVGETQNPDQENSESQEADGANNTGSGTGQTNADGQGQDQSPPTTRTEALAQAVERARRREQEQGQRGTSATDGADTPDSPTPGPEPDHHELSARSSSIANNGRDPQHAGQQSLDDFADDSSTGGQDNDFPNPEQQDTDEPDSSSPTTEEDTDASVHPGDPAHASSASRSPEATEAAYEAALASDERAAHGEADRERIDDQALDAELSDLANQLERSGRHTGDERDASDTGGGTAAGPGSLDDLTVLPIDDGLVPTNQWDAVEDGAERVASTLELYLRLERRTHVRRGLTAGAYDTRAGHRLAIGDPRVCKSRTVGGEKRYALVLVLDRSGSMRRGSPPKIEVATNALARFAVAAERLGIRVAITDFIHGDARLVKPFSVDTRHVQSALLDTSCGGGTPLADALALARDIAEAQRDNPLIITVTDDEPSSVDDVVEQLRRTYAPVCSLTIATDHEPGSLSPDASELAHHYERQTTVHTPDRLDDRLDQFASLLTGL